MRRAYLHIFILAALVATSVGCATKGGPQVVTRENEYYRMLELQKQKAALTAQEQVSGNIPELSAAGHAQLGDQYARQDNSLLALVEYNKALRMEPTRMELRYKIGTLLLKRGMCNEALKEFDEILKKQPTNAAAFYGKAMAHLAKNEQVTAKECLQQALYFDPKLWQARALLGTILDREQAFAPAAEEYRKAIDLNPRSVALYNNLGLSCYFAGEYQKSLDALLKAIRLEPENRKIYNNLGLVFCKLGRYAEALEAFKLGKDEAGAYNNLGYVYMAEAKYSKAIEAFEKAIEINPAFYVKAHLNAEKARAAVKAEGLR